jgi:hypothetical protein
MSTGLEAPVANPVTVFVVASMRRIQSPQKSA